MIHLHRLIMELFCLVREKPHSGYKMDIYKKCGEIHNACEILLKEHGKDSDVGKRLEWIKNYAYGLRHDIESPTDKFIDFASPRVVTMIEEIKEIGKILKIEFKETQS